MQIATQKVLGATLQTLLCAGITATSENAKKHLESEIVGMREGTDTLEGWQQPKMVSPVNHGTAITHIDQTIAPFHGITIFVGIQECFCETTVRNSFFQKNNLEISKQKP